MSDWGGRVVCIAHTSAKIPYIICACIKLIGEHCVWDYENQCALEVSLNKTNFPTNCDLNTYMPLVNQF